MEEEECEELVKKMDEVLENVPQTIYIPEEKPLWLPAGSVRAILSLGTIGTMLWLLSKGLADMNIFLAITGVVFGFYFGSKK